MKADVELENTSRLIEAEEAKRLAASKHCYICKKTGHTKGECPNRRCLVCQQIGHTIAKCPIKGTEEDPLIQEQKRKKKEAAKEAKRRKRRREAQERRESY
jgi:hypothetical protein